MYITLFDVFAFDFEMGKYGIFTDLWIFKNCIFSVDIDYLCLLFFLIVLTIHRLCSLRKLEKEIDAFLNEEKE